MHKNIPVAVGVVVGEVAVVVVAVVVVVVVVVIVVVIVVVFVVIVVTAGLFATPTYFCWQLAFHRHLPTSGRQNRVKNLLYPPFIYIF